MVSGALASPASAGSMLFQISYKHSRINNIILYLQGENANLANTVSRRSRPASADHHFIAFIALFVEDIGVISDIQLVIEHLKFMIYDKS